MTATGETRQFLDEDATKLLLAYGLRLKSLARIWKGTISQNFRAETDIGPVFVRISPGRSVVDAEFESRLIWHLQSHGLRTAALFQAHNRDGYVVLPGKPKALAMVYEWLDGYELTDDKFDERHAHEVGQLLGQLHLCTATLTQRRASAPRSRAAGRAPRPELAGGNRPLRPVSRQPVVSTVALSPDSARQ